MKKSTHHLRPPLESFKDKVAEFQENLKSNIDYIKLLVSQNNPYVNHFIVTRLMSIDDILSQMINTIRTLSHQNPYILFEHKGTRDLILFEANIEERISRLLEAAIEKINVFLNRLEKRVMNSKQYEYSVNSDHLEILNKLLRKIVVFLKVIIYVKKECPDPNAETPISALIRKHVIGEEYCAENRERINLEIVDLLEPTRCQLLSKDGDTIKIKIIALGDHESNEELYNDLKIVINWYYPQSLSLSIGRDKNILVFNSNNEIRHTSLLKLFYKMTLMDALFGLLDPDRDEQETASEIIKKEDKCCPS